jgi:acetoin utilization deacetylase AcuC-like enzyme
MTALVTHGSFLRHRSDGHPECPERLTVIWRHLARAGLWERLVPVEPRPATDEELARVHAPEHVARIKAMGSGWIDADTYVNEHSAEAAVLAAGAALAALESPHRTAICLVRPPGHHATRSQAMGFCLFNNVAVAAAAAPGRVLIVDWDVHHGNGTEEIFAGGERVQYVSFHRWPFYPGTGFQSDGNVHNRPTRVGTPRAEILGWLKSTIAALPKPELVLVSCGFDAYEEDPIGGLGLKPEDYGAMTRLLPDARIVSVLEGGYSLTGLGPCAEHHVRALMDRDP